MLMQILQLSTGAKVLGIFPFQAKSHFIVASALLRELANRGHDVTVISHHPQTEKIANYTDVYVKTTLMDVRNGQGELLYEINEVRYDYL
jgi:glucuronosyltransferase